MKQKLFFLSFALLATQTFVHASEEEGCSGRAGGGGAQTTHAPAAKIHKIHGRAASCSRRVTDPTTIRRGFLWDSQTPADKFQDLINSSDESTALDAGYSEESKTAAVQRVIQALQTARTPEQKHSFIQWIINQADELKETELKGRLLTHPEWKKIISDLEKPIIDSTQHALTERNTHANAIMTESAKLAALQADHTAKIRTHKEETEAAQLQARKEHAARVALALWRSKKQLGTQTTHLLQAHDSHNTALATAFSTAEAIASGLIKVAQEDAAAAIARTAAHHPVAALLTGAAVELGIALSKEYTQAHAQRDELMGVKKDDTEWSDFEQAAATAPSTPVISTSARATSPILPNGYLCTLIVPDEDGAPETDDEAETGKSDIYSDEALTHAAALFKQAKKARRGLEKATTEKGHIKPLTQADRREQKEIVRRLIQQEITKAKSQEKRA